MKIRFCLWFFAFCLAGTLTANGAENESGAAEKAWAGLESQIANLQPPASWRTAAPSENEVNAFRESLIIAAKEIAKGAREFLERYPAHESAGDARFVLMFALASAVAAGDAESEVQAERFLLTQLADAALPPEEKAKVLIASSNVPLLKRLGMRFFVEGQQNFREEMDQAMVEALLDAKKQFAGSDFIYSMLLALAERSAPGVQKELVSEILKSPDVPKEVRFFAEHLARGTRPYELGKPVEVRFTALDGEEVDLAALKGNVVLIDFWSTTCGPCVGQMPELKALMEKYGGQGFQIIGINLDEKESALRRFIQKHEITWPQHFSGKGWANPLATRFGIFAIPTVWLIDKKGNLVSTQARHMLEEMVPKLLLE